MLTDFDCHEIRIRS